MKSLPSPGPLAAHIAEYGHGAKKLLSASNDPVADGRRVMQLNKAFATLIEAIGVRCNDLLTGKAAYKLG